MIMIIYWCRGGRVFSVLYLIRSICRSKVCITSSPQVSFTWKDVLSECMETKWLWNVCISFSLWNKIQSHALDPFVVSFPDRKNNLRYRNEPNPLGFIFTVLFSISVSLFWVIVSIFLFTNSQFWVSISVFLITFSCFVLLTYFDIVAHYFGSLIISV